MSASAYLISSDPTESALAGSYARALESFGVRTTIFDHELRRGSMTPGPRRLSPIVRRALAQLETPAIAQKTDRVLVRTVTDAEPDILMIFCNELVRAGSLLQLKISLPKLKIVNIYPDMLFNVSTHVVQGLPLYDLFCTHTKAGVEPLRLLGCKNPFYLPLAADPELHSPATITTDEAAALRSDIVFVGNWRPEREAFLAHLEGLDLAIYGEAPWKGAKGWVRSRWRGSGVGLWAKAHAASKIGVNVIDPLNLPGHNMRCFEIPACRAFALVTRTPEVSGFFQEGVEVECFGSGEELRAKAIDYLRRPADRDRIAEASFQRVVHGGHTYRDRTRTLLEALGMSELTTRS